MKVFGVISGKSWNLPRTAGRTSSANSGLCHSFSLPPSIVSGTLSGAACIVSSHSGSKMPSHRLLRQRCQSSILGACDRAGAQQVPFVKLQTAATADKVFSNRKRRFLPGSFLFLPPPPRAPSLLSSMFKISFSGNAAYSLQAATCV